ncbi:putative Ig domain-containing protein [Corynebacterium sp.]|uniref:putative Ig domain-containing protein n=1 Tax=Corynebacterium sp. TaxID=1720 RepID=UPI0026DC14DD|nr:putative Ig domain-containing protein [Corynebacterium sp.]MDO5033161.1 putative Ig domain-containing protein [Corynebacterium sp.]
MTFQVTKDGKPVENNLVTEKDEVYLFSGTPSQRGNFPVTIIATNEEGEETRTEFLVRVVAAPQIDLPSTVVEAIAGRHFSMPLELDSRVRFVEVRGLPAGLNYNEENNRIEGVPTQEGSFRATLVAFNNQGKSTCGQLEFRVLPAPVPPQPVEFTGLQAQLPIRVGQEVNAELTLTDPGKRVASFAARGLPDGLRIDAQTGKISGVPERSGSFRAQVFARDSAGAQLTQATFSLTVMGSAHVEDLPLQAPRLQPGQEMEPIDVGIENLDLGSTVRVEGLPQGLYYDEKRQQILGTPAEEGTFDVSITITDANGAVTESGAGLTLIIGAATSDKGSEDGSSSSSSSSDADNAAAGWGIGLGVTALLGALLAAVYHYVDNYLR